MALSKALMMVRKPVQTTTTTTSTTRTKKKKCVFSTAAQQINRSAHTTATKLFDLSRPIFTVQRINKYIGRRREFQREPSIKFFTFFFLLSSSEKVSTSSLIVIAGSSTL
jgi:hypothetical protein